jgi:hypothetical protein
MRLSEEKIGMLALEIGELVASGSGIVRFTGESRALERDIARFITVDLRIEDEITQEALAKMATYRRQVTEGSTEWRVLLDRHKEEIAARRGYVL